MNSSIKALATVLVASTIGGVAMAQTTIIQSNTGVGCSSVCINGNCTSTCGDSTSAGVLKGNGEVETEQKEVSDFTEIVSTDIDTSVVQGAEFSVKVTADSNLLDKVLVKLDGGSLSVRLQNGSYQDATLSVEIVMPELIKLSQYGSADLHFSGFEQPAIEVNIFGTGQVQGSDNKIDDLVLNSQGASTLDMMKSTVANAEVHVTGTVQVRLKFTDGDAGQISGDVAGVSEIHYCGNPKNTVSVLGVSDIQRIDCS